MEEYAAMSDRDWHGPVLAGGERIAAPVQGRNPAAWPGYTPRTAVSAWRLSRAIVASWDFSVYGGSFGEDDATVLEAAARAAVAERLPLVTLVRSGGTRLQEGMAALVGIPRARLALLELARAGLAHLSVADAPTTGGVWISVASAADFRVAVEGATVAFAGPRVVEAFTGTLPPPESHTAESAYAAGLVDALLPGDEVPGWLGGVLTALTPEPADIAPAPAVEVPLRSGWEQVQAARARTTGGAALLAELLTDRVDLRAAGGDETVAAGLGRLGGRPVIGVALAAQLGGRPTPNGYRLAARAYRLADRLGLPILSLVDTPGADPGTASEEGGIAPAMGEALDALLSCASPTLALVHGEGGSGGALAAAVADVVLMTPDSYFAAIGPEGAAAALRRPAEECADLMRVGPAELLQLGFADAIVAPAAVREHLARLSALSPDERIAGRAGRWGLALSGYL
ncbi:MAG: acyl-CoA carboxylase subunit beta [Actinomycetota bacterium]|jgi:acetyl-CoA carboxylase carboxyl transferase subunit beta|nr:acyl-CoA carboxylase subunit beta [Actinomycetota bacterium]